MRSSEGSQFTKGSRPMSPGGPRSPMSAGGARSPSPPAALPASDAGSPEAKGRFKAIASSALSLISKLGNSVIHPGQVTPDAPRSSASHRFAKTGRKIDPVGSNLNSFLFPIVAWGCLTVVAFTLSYLQFSETVGRCRLQAWNPC